uniref:Cas3 protein I-B n=1 Tax=Salinispora fenicalii TaxID=1137263 RepID=A0A059U6J8_9ACTN|nr:Cas3 protein I-B [Salinispora fenicalii]
MDQVLDRVLAKSARLGRPAELLIEHLDATLGAAVDLRRRIGPIAVTEPVLGERFWPVSLLAALTHDTGKVPAGFQAMVTGGGLWGERHEVLSLGFLPPLVPDGGMLLWVAEAVVTHHRPLTSPTGAGLRSIMTLYGGCTLTDFRERFGPVDPVVAAALERWLIHAGGDLLAADRADDTVTGPDVVARAHQVLTDVLGRWRRRRATADEGLTAILLQGAVTLADHLSSAHGTLHVTQPIGPGFSERLRQRFSENGRRPYPHQEQSGALRGHLLLRAPTGSGKTEAGLFWAARQVTDLIAAGAGAPRVFLVLPYLASINAMADRLVGVLGDRELVGVAHSRAASYHLATAIDEAASTDPDTPGQDGSLPLYAARKAVARRAATELFRETVRVGTPYQLLRAALAGPAHAGILLDSANSVFVLDELHAYDPKRLGFILAGAGIWVRLGGRVAVMSATLPAVLADLVRDAIGDPVELVTAPAGLTLPRHRLRLRPHHLTDEEALREARAHLTAGRSVLMVANNVADAQTVFDALAADAIAAHGPDGAILLHSRFRRMDRTRVERKIIDRYGAHRTDCGRRFPGLVVATQVVEVSLDVDFDLLFTSGAPLEALLQRFGRINRAGTREPADVVVHEPSFGPRRGEGRQVDYADGVYDSEPTHAAMRILHQHADLAVDEEHATKWLDEIYASTWGQEWRHQVDTARVDFQQAFLTFKRPYDDRSHLADAFDSMFDGTEAVLLEDLPEYEAALTSAAGRAEGRLLAADWLIPLPGWAVGLSRLDRSLGVEIIDGDYRPDRGLTAIRGAVGANRYQPGEVI